VLPMCSVRSVTYLSAAYRLCKSISPARGGDDGTLIKGLLSSPPLLRSQSARLRRG
jgi:hypothetical protein